MLKDARGNRKLSAAWYLFWLSCWLWSNDTGWGLLQLPGSWMSLCHNYPGSSLLRIQVDRWCHTFEIFRFSFMQSAYVGIPRFETSFIHFMHGYTWPLCAADPGLKCSYGHRQRLRSTRIGWVGCWNCDEITFMLVYLGNWNDIQLQVLACHVVIWCQNWFHIQRMKGIRWISLECWGSPHQCFEISPIRWSRHILSRTLSELIWACCCILLFYRFQMDYI